MNPKIRARVPATQALSRSTRGKSMLDSQEPHKHPLSALRPQAHRSCARPRRHRDRHADRPDSDGPPQGGPRPSEPVYRDACRSRSRGRHASSNALQARQHGGVRPVDAIGGWSGRWVQRHCDTFGSLRSPVRGRRRSVRVRRTSRTTRSPTAWIDCRGDRRRGEGSLR